MSERITKKDNTRVIRTSVAIDEEVMNTIDRLAKQEKTNRNTLINQILSLVCFEGLENEADKAELHTAQMMEKIIKLYLELVNSPEIDELAKKTFRTHELMIKQLVKKGIQLYED